MFTPKFLEILIILFLLLCHYLMWKSSNPLLGMDRLDFLRAQPWLDPDVDLAHRSTQEQAFSAAEIFEGIATIEDSSGQQVGFRASLLASSRETRIRLAIRPASSNERAGSKRRRGDGAADEDGAADAASLFVRFEAAGRALQGRLLHTQIERLSDNVSVPHQPTPDAPFVRMRLGAIDLLLAPLPELTPAIGAEQLRRLLGHMASALPIAGGAAAPVPSAAASALSTEELLAEMGTRTAHWQAFVRCARELANQLDGECAGSDGSGTGSAAAAMRASARSVPSARPAVAELLQALPNHLVRAMPPTCDAADDALLASEAHAADAEACYVRHATRVLCVPPAPPAPLASSSAAENGSAVAEAESALDELDELHGKMRSAYSALLTSKLLPRR